MFLRSWNFENEISVNRYNTALLGVTAVLQTLSCAAITAAEGCREDALSLSRLTRPLVRFEDEIYLTFPGLPPKIRITLELNLSTSGN
jgi:hypothetical protein